jgi:uncharacterized protein MJ1493
MKFEVEKLSIEKKSKVLEHHEICEIIDKYLDDFNSQIKYRGKAYYDNGNVFLIIKNKNTFIAKVYGSSKYEINITIYPEDKLLSYTCTCPCDFPCKHEYAVFLAIKNHEYIEKELKHFINKQEITFQKFIEKIPAKDLKNYILSEEGKENVSFEENHLKDYFISCLPRQSYEYYYNNLYNNIILKNEVNLKYINISKALLNNGEYQEAFDIVKSIIEAANDTEILSTWEELTNCLPVIGMLLRIIYRKANNETINDINIWITKLEKNNYYGSLYLEDTILSVK